MTNFTGQVAIVIGAASGIGAATCKKFLAGGATVAGVDLRDHEAQFVGEDLGATASYYSLGCDVGDRNAVEKCVSDVLSRSGRLDILVNSAGITARNVTDSDDFEAVWDAVMRVTRHPLGRFGTAHEVASVIAFLASSDASFVTAAAWAVDGGYLAS